MSEHPTSPTAFSGLFPKKEKWKWHQAPVKTEWGEDMVVASVSIDKDHTVDLYCERSQTARVEAMFTQQPEQEPVCDKDPQGCWNVRCQLGKVCKNTAPQPRQWLGLTEEEELMIGVATGMTGIAIRMIEAKLKEKNT